MANPLAVLRSPCLPLLLLLLLLLQPLSCYSASPRVVSLPLRGRAVDETAPHRAKRDAVDVSLQNYPPAFRYFVTVGVGSPAQVVELVLAPNAGDTLIFSHGVCQKDSNTGQCLGDEFESKKSSSYQQLNGLGLCNIAYNGGDKINGPYFSDVLTLGGLAITDATMCLGTKIKGQIQAGTLGLGFEGLETRVDHGDSSYVNVPSLLKLQNHTLSTSYSIYLDDITAATGSIIFGGYDSEKFYGQITMLPALNNPYSQIAGAGWYIPWTSFGYMHKDTSKVLYITPTPDPFPLPVFLEAGGILSYIPFALYKPLIDLFGLHTRFDVDDVNTYYVDCDYYKAFGDASFVFTFGSKNGGKTILVPYKEMAVPRYTYEGGTYTGYNNGAPLCYFGMQPTTKSQGPQLAQSFLRSVYALYNIDQRYLGLAQAKFDTSASNIVEYEGYGTEQDVVTDTLAPSVSAFAFKSYTKYLSSTKLKTSTAAANFRYSPTIPNAPPPTSYPSSLSVAAGATVPTTPTAPHQQSPTGASSPKGNNGGGGSSNLGVKVGVPVAVVVVLIIVAIVGIILWRRRKARRNTPLPQAPPTEPGVSQRDPSFQPPESQGGTFVSNKSPQLSQSPLAGYYGSEKTSEYGSYNPDLTHQAGPYPTYLPPAELDSGHEPTELSTDHGTASPLSQRSELAPPPLDGRGGPMQPSPTTVTSSPTDGHLYD